MRVGPQFLRKRSERQGGVAHERLADSGYFPDRFDPLQPFVA
jgi:hypothetical protein